MTIAIQLFLGVVSLWSAHVAGSLYASSREDKSLIPYALARTAISIAALALIFLV
jgi:hypothetical protein